MNAQSYIEQSHTISSRAGHNSGKDDKSRETLFGLVLALTSVYAIGSLLVFVASWMAR